MSCSLRVAPAVDGVAAAAGLAGLSVAFRSSKFTLFDD